MNREKNKILFPSGFFANLLLSIFSNKLYLDEKFLFFRLILSIVVEINNELTDSLYNVLCQLSRLILTKHVKISKKEEP